MDSLDEKVKNDTRNVGYMDEYTKGKKGDGQDGQQHQK
jgi:hypothetical protein